MDYNIRAVVASAKKLASMDPSDPGVVAESDALAAALGGVEYSPPLSADFLEGAGAEDAKVASDESKFLLDQLKKLHRAAEIPSKNYGRILAISAALGRAVQIARRPQNAEVRPKIASIVKKVAGLFAEVDTAEDLDKPLSEIERAVHGLYGDQSSNKTFYFDRRGKGHHGDHG
jgi:hypothetical protein